MTILERGERLLSAYEPEIGVALAEILRARPGRADGGAGPSVCVPTAPAWSSRPRSRAGSAFAAARVLVTTGRQPNSAGVGLEDAGVRLDARGTVIVDEYLRTGVPHIWAAGDVIAMEQDSQMATPVGAHDGGIVAQTLSPASPCAASITA